MIDIYLIKGFFIELLIIEDINILKYNDELQQNNRYYIITKKLQLQYKEYYLNI